MDWTQGHLHDKLTQYASYQNYLYQSDVIGYHDYLRRIAVSILKAKSKAIAPDLSDDKQTELCEMVNLEWK